MKYNLVIKEEAIADMQDAYDYYEEKKVGLGVRFLDELDYYFDQIQKYPNHYQIKTNPFRQTVVKKFPFVIIYEIIKFDVVVYAVFNTWRDPIKKPKKK